MDYNLLRSYVCLKSPHDQSLKHHCKRYGVDAAIITLGVGIGVGVSVVCLPISIPVIAILIGTGAAAVTAGISAPASWFSKDKLSSNKKKGVKLINGKLKWADENEEVESWRDKIINDKKKGGKGERTCLGEVGSTKGTDKGSKDVGKALGKVGRHLVKMEKNGGALKSVMGGKQAYVRKRLIWAVAAEKMLLEYNHEYSKVMYYRDILEKGVTELNTYINKNAGKWDDMMYRCVEEVKKVGKLPVYAKVNTVEDIRIRMTIEKAERGGLVDENGKATCNYLKLKGLSGKLINERSKRMINRVHSAKCAEMCGGDKKTGGKCSGRGGGNEVLKKVSVKRKEEMIRKKPDGKWGGGYGKEAIGGRQMEVVYSPQADGLCGWSCLDKLIYRGGGKGAKKGGVDGQWLIKKNAEKFRTEGRYGKRVKTGMAEGIKRKWINWNGVIDGIRKRMSEWLDEDQLDLYGKESLGKHARGLKEKAQMNEGGAETWLTGEEMYMAYYIMTGGMHLNVYCKTGREGLWVYSGLGKKSPEGGNNSVGSKKVNGSDHWVVLGG